MPVFHVTAPDGHTYEINAPEGASEQDAIAYAQANLGKPQAQTPSPSVGTSEAAQPSFWQGVGDSVASGYKAVNDFGNDLGDSLAHHVANIPVGLAQLGMQGSKAVGDVVAPADKTLSGLITGKQSGNW